MSSSSCVRGKYLEMKPPTPFGEARTTASVLDMTIVNLHRRPRKPFKKGPKRPPPGYVRMTMHALRELHAPSRHHFDKLDHAAQVKAVKDMAAEGYSDYTIATSTRWSVEAVREALGQ